ncbi:hypothetical protein [Nocardia cyriacigeorgica]|uniref:hypothetical protein n=1 Tax=Nocardia cyriacigeorgica TaxID=135487 RepID=UPI002458F380|nr:hypothetical protein [Nocardia cyriacigeorgica]
MSTNTRPKPSERQRRSDHEHVGRPVGCHRAPRGRGRGKTRKQKGFDVVDTFTCRGFDTWLPLRIVGGIQKGHPDEDDLLAARTFAADLRARVETA